MGAIFRIFPLILVVVVVYNLVVAGAVTIGGIGVQAADGSINMEALLGSVVLTIPMVSGPWALTVGTLFVTVGLICLFIEVLRSASSDSIAITNHALSLVVLVICLIEFVVVKGFNTSVFFYLTMMAVIDVVAGFTVSIISSRRDFGAGGGVIAPH